MTWFVDSSVKSKLKQELNVIYRPRGGVFSPKWLFLVENDFFKHLAAVGNVKTFKFSILIFHLVSLVFLLG